MHTPPSSLKTAQQGVILIEVMVAILIFSVGVLAIVGLQASMIKNTADSKYRSEASYIAQSTLGMMWADATTQPADGSTTVTAITSQLPGGSLSTTRAGSVFTVTVTWLQPGPNQQTHNYTTTARIAGG